VELNTKLKNFKSQDSSLEKYYEVRNVWIDMTGQVYEAGSFDEDYVQKSFSEEERGEADLCLTKLSAGKSKIKTTALKTFVLASSLRTREISYQSVQDGTPIFKWTNDYFKDHLLEVKVIPLRWVAIFTSKLDRFQADISAGVEGWLKVAKDLFLLLVFILSLMGFLWFSLKFHTLVSAYREKLLKYFYSNKKTYRLGYWTQKIIPYLPWVLLITFVKIEQSLIRNTYFSDLNILFPYITYYGVYKLIRIFVSQVLINFLSYAKAYELKLLKKKVEHSANVLSLFVIWSLVFLHTAESAVGRGFIYIWISRIFAIGLVYIFVSQSKKWESEIEDMLKGIAPERLYKPLIRFVDRLFVARSIILLVCSIVFYVSTLLYNWFQTLEISKTLSARVFRERVKSASKKAQEGVSDRKTKDYDELFASTNLVQKVESQEKIIASIEEYIEKKKAQECYRKNIGVIGEKGLGKTHLLNLMEERLGQSLSLRRVSIGSRGQAPSFLQKCEDIVSQAEGETVVIIDDLHYLFLSKVGGFEKIKKFFTFIDKSPDNVSWVVVINKSSWNYLDAILHKTRYFSSTYNIEKWSEEEIKNLVLSKHKETGYSLSFNNILLAMKSENYYEDKKYVEEKYFRILWEESLGNPDIAQKLWVESLSPSARPKNLNVGIPHSRFETIKGLPNEFYFVLASIVRHVDISLEDLAIVNDVDIDFVRNAVEFCEDKGYVVKRGRSVKMAPLWQNNIITTLVGKNYIYGK
jgi:hypothetical protein